MSELGTNTTNVLNRVATVLAELHPLDEALRQVVSITCEQLLCSEAGIWLLDKEQDSLCLSVAVPKTAKLRTSLSPSGQGMLNKVSETRLPCVVTGGEWGLGDAPFLKAGFAAGLGVPIIWRGVVYGVLVLVDIDPERKFEPHDVQVVQFLAQQIAALVSGDRLEQGYREMQEGLLAEQERLLHLQVAIRQMLEQPDMRANLVGVTEALQALGWRRVVLGLFTTEWETEEIIAVGVPETEMPRYRNEIVPVEIWQKYLRRELEHNRLNGLVFVPAAGEKGKNWHQEDVLFAPLSMGKGEPIGLIRLEDPVDGLRPTRVSLRPMDILASQAAYVVENARLLEETSRIAETLSEQVDELSMMHRADRELSSHLNVDRVMTLTMDWALRRTGADTGLLSLMTDDRSGLVPFVMLGYIDRPKLDFTEQRPMPLDMNIIGRAAKKGETQFNDAVSPDADFVEFMPNAKTHVSVPLSMRGEVLGVLSLASSNSRAFDEHDLSFLERLARRAAVALDNARLFRQAEQLADDLTLLYTASRTITSTLERDEMLQRIAQSMTAALECSSTVIFDFRPDSDSVQVLGVYKLGTAHDAQESLPAVRTKMKLETFPALRRVIEKRRPVLLSRAADGLETLDRAMLDENKIEAAILVPLVAQDELVGLAAVIEGRHERQFTSSEVFKAETLASQASVALRQSMLFGEVLELEKLKSEMIRMASHDLRNPLNNLMGYVELISLSFGQYGMTPDQEQYINSMRRSAQAMKSLINDLLTLERIESDRQSDWQQFDLGGLIFEVVEAAQASAQLKDQTLNLQREMDTPAMFGSITQLRQAVANLVDNAIKYTPEKGRIQVRFATTQGRLDFSVEDDGYGISPERQARVFERFYRAREPGTDHIGGTGLGLSLVKTVVERHGGEVWFKSQPGEGSTFGFWLPSVAE